MLARIAQELFWLGRDLARAEHTARMLDGAFHADVAGAPGERGIALSWEGVLAVIGAKPLGHEPASSDAGGGEAGDPTAAVSDRHDVAALLTLEPDSPASIVSCVARARERGRVLRDVISTEMWEALNSFYLSLSRYDLQAALLSGPYSVYQEVKERCALFWGLVDRTMLRDEGRSFLEAGGRIEEADMVLRMLRVAIPAGAIEPSGDDEPDPGYEGEALALLQAVGGFQAYRRATPQAPSLLSVARFLLYESCYPGSVASSLEALSDGLATADLQPRSSPPVLRLGRLIADLELRRRTSDSDGSPTNMLERVQGELELVDRDIDERYFAFAASRMSLARPVQARSAAGRAVRPEGGPSVAGSMIQRPEMNFAIRYLTRYEYDADVVDNLNALRVKPTGNGRQRCDEFSVMLAPEVRLHRHNDYFGTEVVEFEVSHPHRALTIDVRARVTTKPPPEPPAATWEALRAPGYREAGGEFLLQTDDAPDHPALEGLLRATRAAPTPLATVVLLSELIPDRFEYRRGATYVDSTVAHLLDVGAGVCQDFVHLALCVLRRHGIAARYVSGYLFAAGAESSQESVEVDTHAWLEALLPVGAAESQSNEPIWVGADPTNRGLTGENHVKIGHGRHYPDVPPIKGVYRGIANATLNASVTMTRLTSVDPASIARS
jgi:uncharacterized alpha-E superfamily protein/transglutaminase-like putative cysteine protease